LNGTTIIPRFLEGPRGRIFVLTSRPAGHGGASVLIVPPFAEEMNKSRKVFTDLARRLAQKGIAAIIPDLYGTGDSGGEFREADWDHWVENLALAASAAAADSWPVTGLVATRLGCLLAARAARDSLKGIQRTVFWQPVTDGDRYLTQFLRLRVAASMADASRKETVAQLKEQMQKEQVLEVSGYEIPARLATQMSHLRLASELSARLGTVHWIEMVRDADAPVPAATLEFIEKARSTPLEIVSDCVAGEPFWQTTEIVRNAALVNITVAALTSKAAVAGAA
jgi:exosortase A-associated hydrolase 2